MTPTLSPERKDKQKKEPLKCFIMIEGESAEELYTAGPVDLRDYFFPEWAKITPDDIKCIKFTRTTKRDELGLVTEWVEHPKNFDRRKE